MADVLDGLREDRGLYLGCRSGAIRKIRVVMGVRDRGEKVALGPQNVIFDDCSTASIGSRMTATVPMTVV